jgi:hypothetical protein
VAGIEEVSKQQSDKTGNLIRRSQNKEQKMNNSRKTIAVWAFPLSVASLAAAGHAPARECLQAHAEIVSALTATGCTSSIGLCTAGTIDGNRGLNGTTFFTVDSAAPGPSTAPNLGATISYRGVPCWRLLALRREMP